MAVCTNDYGVSWVEDKLAYMTIAKGWSYLFLIPYNLVSSEMVAGISDKSRRALRTNPGVKFSQSQCLMVALMAGWIKCLMTVN